MIKTSKDIDQYKSFKDASSITFFFPYKEVGGVSVLFLRISEYIAEQYGIVTKIIDYKDGFMSTSLKTKKTSVQTIHFQDGTPIHIPEDTILVMQSMIPYNIPSELKIDKNAKIIFWTQHPFNIVPLHIFHYLQAKHITFHKLALNTVLSALTLKLRSFVTMLASKNSIFFMDGPTLRSTSKRLGVRIANPIYMPIPCDGMHKHNVGKKGELFDKKGHINFCWVGRLADFKIHILVYSIKQIAAYAMKNCVSIRMHVIGVGPESDKIETLNVNNDFFGIVNVGLLTGKSLESYLLSSVDVLVAMGAAALDGAKLGIPTILLDFSYGPVPDGYKFKWLFDSEDYALGDVISAYHCEEYNDSMSKVIDTLLHEYQTVSNKTYEYCIRNHSLSDVCSKFMTALSQASLRYQDISPSLLKKGSITKMYELTRDYFYAIKSFVFRHE